MTWAQLTIEDAFLILSILSGTGAAAILLHNIMRSKPHNNQLANWQPRPSVLDRITLLNRNLIQCPTCFTIQYANAQSCSRCGMPTRPPDQLPRNNMQYAEARYLLQDGSNQIFGLSIKPDPKTRIGIIIGIQNQETQERISENQN